MSTIGDRLGVGARLDVGAGIGIAPEDLPKEEDIFYSQWQAGLIVSESPESIPDTAAANLLDTEVDKTDALVRAAGVSLDRDITPHVATWLFQQAAVDFSTELIIIDPPYVGYKSTGDFTFNSLGIAATSEFGWAAADVLGQFLFSNGLDATYLRDPNSNTVTDISADIIAQCFATFAGRVFAGAFVDAITGIQSLAVAWNAASGDVTDWTGLGSGSEFLISNNLVADRLVSMVPLGLQTLAILNRKSLWAGYQTGNSDRPADFQIRFPGFGCVSRDTAASSPFGVVFLSDDGVCLYDLNNAKIISQPIDGILLPLNYAELNKYRAMYHSSTQRYILVTPTGTLIYQFPLGSGDDASPDTPGRWFYRSYKPESLVSFADQSGNVYWDTVIGIWNDQTLTWAEMVIGENNAPALLYEGKSTQIGFEDYGATDNMGEAQNPIWQTPQKLQHVTDIIETHMFEIQYRSQADADITLTTTDTMGALSNSITKTLPNTAGVRARCLIGTHTMAGMGSELQISFAATAICAIERVRRVVVPAGQSIQVSI